MITLRLRAAALLLAVCCAPGVARADVSDADRATARTLAGDGQDALDRADYATALDRFARADALLHAPTLLIGVARAQVGLRHLVAAQEAYNRILREGVTEGSPEPFFLALDEAKKELTALTPRVPSVTIQVRGPHAPQVTLDDRPVPIAALGARRPVDPGVRVLRATAEGYAPSEAKIRIDEGKNEIVVLTLQPLETPATPLLPPGPNGPPMPTAARRDPRGGDSSRTTLGIAALGVGGAGLALGAVTGLLALGKHADLEDNQCGGDDHCPVTAQSDIDSYHTLGTLSTIGFIVGGAGIGAGALLIVTAPSPKPPKGAWIVPRIGLGLIGAEGRF